MKPCRALGHQRNFILNRALRRLVSGAFQSLGRHPIERRNLPVSVSRGPENVSSAYPKLTSLSRCRHGI